MFPNSATIFGKWENFTQLVKPIVGRPQLYPGGTLESGEENIL
jgi:hypothetical protein